MITDTFISILPQLGIGAIAVIGLIYTHKYMADKAEEKDKAFFDVLQERETAFRQMEKEARTMLYDQVTKNTNVMERVVILLNNQK